MEVKGLSKLDPIKEFRDDHRKVRDGLLEMIDALKTKNISKASEILGKLDIMVGPHFRYEEESLYPVMKTFLGEYVDDLISEHDGVIETARNTVKLLNKKTLTEKEGKKAAEAAQKLLIHVSNCDGLAILTERLSSEELEGLGEKYSIAREANIPMLEWAEKIRKR
ncbi:MAG: hemerythrin domain-containing protein [Candidatus Thorarchaeota archaeon]